MKEVAINETQTRSKLVAEFDALADEYRVQHKDNISITGESPEYFSEYKILDLRKFLCAESYDGLNICDFGSGIGNSVPFFRKYFPTANLTCSDVSVRSMEISQTRFPGVEKYILIEDTIPLPTCSQDIIFSACVFHHIPHAQHIHWLTELHRISKPGGILAIYEHNPLNPLTVRAVNTCPLDVNAKLIRGSVMRDRAIESGWISAKVDYKVFFPSILAKLRPIERNLEWLGLGAQYRMTTRKSS